MTTILLVEDDKSLREIYGVRLLAEGYDIVSAGDGEEALAIAIKVRPVLIITDVMMPRISGFDMLDILRSTTETKNIKVIMMTALSSEDQRRHGEQLGADRYLVKSQVGIEDVVRVVHEVLGDAKTPPPPAASAPAVPKSPTPPSTPAPAAPAPVVSTPPIPAVPPVIPQSANPLPVPAVPPQAQPAADPMFKPMGPAVMNNMATPKPSNNGPTPSNSPGNVGTKQRIIQPINDPTAKIDINNLLDKELAREAGLDVNNRPAVATTQQERAVVDDQIRSVVTPAVASVQPAAPRPPITAIPQQPAAPVRPPVQAPPRPNVAPIQPRQGGAPPTPGGIMPA